MREARALGIIRSGSIPPDGKGNPAEGRQRLDGSLAVARPIHFMCSIIILYLGERLYRVIDNCAMNLHCIPSCREETN